MLVSNCLLRSFQTHRRSFLLLISMCILAICSSICSWVSCLICFLVRAVCLVLGVWGCAQLFPPMHLWYVHYVGLGICVGLYAFVRFQFLRGPYGGIGSLFRRCALRYVFCDVAEYRFFCWRGKPFHVFRRRSLLHYISKCSLGVGDFGRYSPSLSFKV